MRTFRLASRGSALALWQAEHVKQRLERADPGLRVAIEIIRTTGDRITDVPLARIGDKGLFTKDVDSAVLEGRADAAIHSLKDVPTVLADGLTLGAVLEREDPRDALVVAPGLPSGLRELPSGARIGTSSLRRRAQLLHARDDVRIEDLRGNLDTRLSRVSAGDYDAAILALAGIRRLDREGAVSSVLGPPEWLPAVGQGALALAIRSDDSGAERLVRVLESEDSRVATSAERAFLRRLEGGCQVPIGALGEVLDGRMRLRGLVASLDGSSMVRGEIEGRPEEAVALGTALAEELESRGGAAILERIRRRNPDDLPAASAP